MGDTKIQWSQKTWNPVRGCSRVSPGCVNCYAERAALRMQDGAYKGLVNVVNGHPSWTGIVRALTGETLEQPLHWPTPARVFVNSMSDLFHEALPDEAIDRVFAVMALCPQHTFQILTKRAERMLAWSRLPRPRERPGQWWDDWRRRVQESGTLEFAQSLPAWPLPNVWLGVSVETQEYADERIPLLLQTPAAVHFVSYEPALGPVDFTNCGMRPFGGLNRLRPSQEAVDHGIYENLPALKWVIVGGESGPGARPFDIQWARAVVRQCEQAGTACFVKQLGAKIIGRREDFSDYAIAWTADDGTFGLNDSKGGDPQGWPKDLRVRQYPA